MSTREQQEKTYQKIMLMYDVVEDMIKAIEDPIIKGNKEKLQMAEQFIAQSIASTEIILTTYMENVGHGGVPSSEDSKKIEAAARKIFIEMAKLVAYARQHQPITEGI